MFFNWNFRRLNSELLKFCTAFTGKTGGYSPCVCERERGGEGGRVREGVREGERERGERGERESERERGEI